jgi:drug/metabolite transporter (DMT)-like permease
MLKGVGLKIASAFAFALMSTVVKVEAAAFPIAQIVFFRSLFAMALLVVWLAARGEFPAALHTRRPGGHLVRSLIGSGGMFSSFLSVALLPLADSTALSYAAPLMTVALAALFLGEAVRVYRWAAVAAGLVGVVVMLSDHLGEGGAGSSLGVAAALTGAVCAAAATIQTRRLVTTEQTGAIVFYFSLTTTLMGALALTLAAWWPADWPLAAAFASQRWAAPDFGGFLWLALTGILGGFGQIFMTQSYRYADASIIACFDYSSMIFAATLSLIVFDVAPSPRILLGAAIVAAAGLFVIWRERRLGVVSRKAREAGPSRAV